MLRMCRLQFFTLTDPSKTPRRSLCFIVSSPNGWRDLQQGTSSRLYVIFHCPPSFYHLFYIPRRKQASSLTASNSSTMFLLRLLTAECRTMDMLATVTGGPRIVKRWARLRFRECFFFFPSQLFPRVVDTEAGSEGKEHLRRSRRFSSDLHHSSATYPYVV